MRRQKSTLKDLHMPIQKPNGNNHDPVGPLFRQGVRKWIDAETITNADRATPPQSQCRRAQTLSAERVFIFYVCILVPKSKFGLVRAARRHMETNPHL